MDLKKLSDLLGATVYSPNRSVAEQELNHINKIAGFGPTLMEIIHNVDIDLSTRQAAAIYMKNFIQQHWATREDEPEKFSIHEVDRMRIRNTILSCMVTAPELIQNQFAVGLVTMMKHDFPGRWSDVIEKIDELIKMDNLSCWMAGILGFSALVKAFEYQKADKSPIHGAVKVLLPNIYNVMITIVNVQTIEAIKLQKIVVKSYFKLIQFSLSPDLMERTTFTKWMELLSVVLCNPIPVVSANDQALWWKAKKWALHSIYRIFERYGCPGNSSQEYQLFAAFYVKTFSSGVIDIILRILDQYRNKIYVPPRVMQMGLNYLNQCIIIAYTWKIIKPHVPTIIQDIIFPLMCHSDADQELWESDPHEYINQKFDIFEDLISPVMASQSILHSACKKRKDILPKAVQFIVGVITSVGATPAQKDGALHMLGALADVIFKKDMYKNQVDEMLYRHVFPVFQSPHGHLRARACWFIQHVCDVKINNAGIWKDLSALCSNALLSDKELPVKIQAGLAIQALLIAEDGVEQFLEPQIKEIVLELLNVLKETENDDITCVVQKVIAIYYDKLAPIMYEICQNLVATFLQVLQSDEMSDKKEITGMSILSCIETILSVNDEQPHTLAALEPIVLEVIVHIFSTDSGSEYYEEALNLVCDLTNTQVSPNMWSILQLIYNVFQNDGIDYFVDMMPCLHNYVTIGTDTFISHESNIGIIFEMCKKILETDAGEEAECHAAKLLEVILLQCKGRIDQCILPIVDVALNRLLKEIKSSELRAMCLQVIVAAIYYNPHLLFETLEKLQPNISSNEPISVHFIRQWLQDTDCFFGIHDRKLCVLGLLTLMSLPPNRPIAVSEHAPQIVPSMLMLFDGLKRAYMNRDIPEGEESSQEEDTDTENELGTDEDEIDENLYINEKRKSSFMTINDENTEEDTDSEDEDYVQPEETLLEVYTTPLDSDDNNTDETLDIYILFKNILLSIQHNDPAWYLALTNHLNSDQQKSINEIMAMAETRRVEVENKKKEKLAGFKFDQATVPTTFSFSNSNNSPFAFGR
ncbi:Armadillo-type fold,Armadillo-like helical,Importin-beta, N-terminal domain [Cinara cedri]|uniref:Armadillo-type fold,Armadillo-like helical,Importin-beta, N-terminal domain n=1 Tax=Cinara cedri TaxID=506608 RepID=A0A5E4NT28_9HEMI|nr:Armadillo-type fold,Armadillo-like helical,Importin-beta, N-terminal domain [Cinara cedri]